MKKDLIFYLYNLGVVRKMVIRGGCTASFGVMLCVGTAWGQAKGGEAGGGEAVEVAEQTAEDEELARRLQAEAAGREAETALTRMLRYMKASRDALRDRFDPGEQTQAIQKKILEDLEEAIRLARSQMRKSSKDQSSSPSRDARRAGKPQKAGSSSQDPQAGQQTNPQGAADEEATQGQAQTGKVGGELREAGREWGHLPQRAREEVVQGFSEDVLLKYKTQIEKYYRALAEQNEGR